MKIAFHCNQLSLRGTEVAMFDYAHYNEEILGNKSIVLTKHPETYKYSDPLAIKKFENRFTVVYYENVGEIEKLLEDHKVDIFYAQKSGHQDGVVSTKVKTAIHVVFQDYQPHGTVYAFISEWLDKLYGSKHGFVPYIVRLPERHDNLRKVLNIPDDAFVFGRHGGYETFDIPFVKEEILKIAKENSKVYFLFMYTEPFSDPNIHPNIIYLTPTASLDEKTQFINTCDAMIHARLKGETFGLAVAEFSLRNKPVVTYSNSRDMAHGLILGEKGFFYDTREQLRDIIDRLVANRLELPIQNWNCYQQFNPHSVMEKFKQVFIDNASQ